MEKSKARERVILEFYDDENTALIRREGEWRDEWVLRNSLGEIGGYVPKDLGDYTVMDIARRYFLYLRDEIVGRMYWDERKH